MQKLLGTLAVLTLIVALLAWLLPFGALGPSPIAGIFGNSNQSSSAPTTTSPTQPFSAPLSTSTESQTQARMTADEVLSQLIPNDEERKLAKARPIGIIGWVVDTKNGQPSNGPRITFYYPGRGVFHYWGGEPEIDFPCKPQPGKDGNSGNWELACAQAGELPIKLDGVSWYP